MPIIDATPLQRSDATPAGDAAGDGTSAGHGASAPGTKATAEHSVIEGWATRVRELRAAADQHRIERRKTQRALKNMRARVGRLKKKAKDLTESDMLEILRTKREIAAARDEEPSGSRSRGASAASSGAAAASSRPAETGMEEEDSQMPEGITSRFDE